jgi:hypothetical protein
MPLLVADLPPAILHYRAALDALYGDRIERVVLYGSRARGDAHAESDYDIAVFLRGMTGDRQERDRLADLSTQILVEEGLFIHALPFRAGTHTQRTPLMHEIRADGIDL